MSKLCKWFGHKYEPVGFKFYHYYCERCHCHSNEAEASWWERTVARWRLWWEWGDTWVHRLRKWVRCRDCKCWFGNHSDDCIPF